MRMHLGTGRSADVLSHISDVAEHQAGLRWHGTFSDYLEMVTDRPRLVRSAHQYLYEAVTYRQDFFRTGQNAVFGMDRGLNQLLGILKAGGEGLELRSRIILLLGPVGGGKSTLVSALKRALERYSETDEGTLYAIADCPMHEEPLHLIPGELRPHFEYKYGIKVDGELCPHCQARHGGRLAELGGVPVTRIVFSEPHRVGIGTFTPSDPKSQDITELVGSVDFSKLGEYGVASDPRAYRFDGELNVANRGLIEFVELLKVDEKFLYVLLSLAQERVIKTGRFANITADMVIVGHTNEAEYRRFSAKKENEALLDRMVVIAVPYNLRVSDEIRIYDKLVEQSHVVTRNSLHISPVALKLASIFAVRSRLKETPSITPMMKLKIYDDGNVEGKSPEELRREFPEEGMDGISPRYVTDCVSMALVHKGLKCLTGLKVLAEIADGVDMHPQTRNLTDEEKDVIKNIVDEVLEEYRDLAQREIMESLGTVCKDRAQALLDRYLANIMAACGKTKVMDPQTGEPSEPDQGIMDAIEDYMGITGRGRGVFRNHLVSLVSESAGRGEWLSANYPLLLEAVERKMVADLANAPEDAGNEDRKHIREFLIDQRDYCSECAEELIRCAGIGW